MSTTSVRRAGIGIATALAVATVAAPALAATTTKPTTLTLAAKHQTVKANTAATFTAHLTSNGTGVQGKTVTLWERVASSKPWHQVGTSAQPTNAKGNTTVSSPALTRDEEFQARFAGGNGDHASRSGVVTVHVAWAVTLTGPTSGSHTTPMSFDATVSPIAKGKNILLQVANGSEWKTVGQAKESSTGKATFKVTMPAGSYTFRARANADSAHASGVSNTVKTTVS